MCVGLGACAYSGPRYVPRPDVPLSQYTSKERVEDYADRKSYREYEQREQCQHYRRVPRHSEITASCLVRRELMHQQSVRTRLLPVIHSYTLYFDFDKSNIRGQDVAVLDQISNELAKYNPAQVTITGFTDRSGSVDYNQALSQRRAESVSKALLDRGITTQNLDEYARGEDDNAVPTPDGVKLQANRRVVVDFRR
jgi:outer membrane protein OmpA-like peptidoglycan-associated protein